MEKSFVSIFTKLEQQVDLSYAMKDLLLKIQKQGCSAQCLHKSKPPPNDLNHSLLYAEEQLVTIRHAMLIMNVSRGTIHTLRKEGQLTSLYKKRNVWLIKEEVLRLKETYSKMKGKI